MAASSHPVFAGAAVGVALVACGSTPAAVSSGDGGVLDSASPDSTPEGSVSDGPGGPDATLGDDGGELDGSSTGADGAALDAGSDVNPDAPLVQPTCPPWQPHDAGAYGNLATLPVAALCASYFDSVSESAPCQGTILVWWATGADSQLFNLYEAATGALVAQGSAFMSAFSCQAVAPGFQFPFQCLNNAGWYPQRSICTDGGATDAGPDGAPLEAGD